MIALLILGMLGCGCIDSPPTKAANIANSIGGDPAKVEGVLSAEGLSAARLDDLVYLVAMDADMSASYVQQLR